MPQATGLAALLQKILPGMSAGADKLFQPGGALGPMQTMAGQQAATMGQPLTGPQPMPTGGPETMAEQQALAMQQQQGGMGQGLASLTQNPAFTMGMGILQGNQRGDPFGGAMQGLQGANQAAIEAADRERQNQLRQAMADYFKSKMPAETADPTSPEMMAADYGTAVGDMANQQRTNAIMGGQPDVFGGQQMQNIDPMLRMLLEQGQPGATNPYGGINPFMLG